MANSLVWDGLKEYLEELQRMPDECRGEAAKLIEGGVNAAHVTISAVYGAHRFSGELQKRLTIKTVKGGLVLTSGSPIAGLFERGTQARHWASKSRTFVGRMPPNPIFSRTVGQERRKLTEQFKAMLLRRGAASVTDTEE
jgi:hypothetical protein